jgi:poly-gamma-glutamate capsule biosynthesis protein CapA/YwtB (metallophosphatase superfamily)
VPDGGVTLFLGGDLMTGRGVDQILPRPGSPTLRERSVRDARDYVALAESTNGAIPWPADFGWPWGDLLTALDEFAPDVRLVNLETAITARGDFAPGKAVHYRMHPDNVPCLTAARLDICALANNHLLDFGPEGLADTVECLDRAGISPVGAGTGTVQAWQPARRALAGGGRLLVWSAGAACSGVPPGWAAVPDRPGVAYLDRLADDEADVLVGRIREQVQPGDLVMLSVHWGSNWGHEVPAEHVRFAHRLVDAGVHLVHGHSSHHARPVEVYRNRLILYGCGDLLDDYEGISGYEAYRPELRLGYLPTLDRDSGALLDLRMVPLRTRRMRLERAAPADAEWLAGVLSGTSHPFGSVVRLAGGILQLSWG